MDKDSTDLVFERLRTEFIEDAVDRLGDMQAAIDGARKSADGGGFDTVMALRRQMHNLKGNGASLGYPLVSLVAGRFEDYVQGRERLDGRELDAIQIFIDRIGEIIRRGIDERADPTAGAELLRGLPARADVEAMASATTRDVEVLLVTSSRVVGRLVEREMSSLGYRVTGAPSPFVAFELAVRIKPALMLVSATLEGLDGLDLARALGAMATTREVPVLVLTSFAAGDARLRDLPANARIVQTGAAFTEQLADALMAFKLL